MSPSVSGPFLYLFSSKNAIFHKFLYRTFWYSRNYTYFYFPKWRYKPRMVLKITNLHILRYLPTCWLYLLERYTIDNQRCTHTAVSYTHLDVYKRQQLTHSLHCSEFVELTLFNKKNHYRWVTRLYTQMYLKILIQFYNFRQ